MVARRGHLGDRVADIEDRHPDLVAQPLEVGQDLLLARGVERGERLVHQQQPRAREQRAADRDALLLAAGEAGGPAIEQVADAEQLDDAGDLGRRRAASAANQRPKSRFCRTVRCGKSRPSWKT